MPPHDVGGSLPRRATWEFPAIGTAWSIQTRLPLEPVDRRLIADLIDRFDRSFSRFRQDSLVAEISRRVGTYELPPEGEALFDLMDEMDALTAGRFNPLVGRPLEHLGYDRLYTLRPDGRWSEPAPWSSVRREGRRL